MPNAYSLKAFICRSPIAHVHLPTPIVGFAAPCSGCRSTSRLSCSKGPLPPEASLANTESRWLARRLAPKGCSRPDYGDGAEPQDPSDGAGGGPSASAGGTRAAGMFAGGVQDRLTGLIAAGTPSTFPGSGRPERSVGQHRAPQPSLSPSCRRGLAWPRAPTLHETPVIDCPTPASIGASVASACHLKTPSTKAQRFARPRPGQRSGRALARMPASMPARHGNGKGQTCGLRSGPKSNRR